MKKLIIPQQKEQVFTCSLFYCLHISSISFILAVLSTIFECSQSQMICMLGGVSAPVALWALMMRTA